ncbi:uncharacterized protein LOC100908479 [Galendromus occidentalis]|uniref:Uncharacterized protein LOC100908479 n=1 Tax=Galendromus occidentalis TaxID=34638 RepID=A0AAJ6VV93_9ACAR|nr:uncharacterized protein LOC100908479 [Galendromus occidentalis]
MNFFVRALYATYIVSKFLNPADRIIAWCQHQHCRAEIDATRAGERPQTTSKLAAFKLFLDEDGLLRAETRLTEGPFFTHDERNPVVIPGESRFAKLLIMDSHRVNAHFGVNTILNHLRRRFWVTRARQIIKGILHRCVTCRRRQGKFARQIEAPLPEARLEFTVPFRVTGIDFCGPFFVTHQKTTSKAYVALFTCGASRAIHLELVPSQSTPQTHLAIRRFLATYPGCVKFISDNGCNFVKAATDIKRLFNAMKKKETAETLEGRSID